MVESAKKLAESALLVLAARLMSVVGVPVGMAVLAWLISGQIAQDKAMATTAIEIQGLKKADEKSTSELADLRRRQEDAASENRRLREVDANLTRDMQQTLTRAVALLEGQGKSIARVEAFVDRQPRP